MAKVGLEADDLALGMDAGVRSAGELNHDGLAGDALQHVLEHALHGAQAGLDLKAVEVGTVVLDDNFDL